MRQDQVDWKANFNPSFHSQLFFVYLNRKQNSQKSIKVLDLSKLSTKDAEEISELTMAMVETQNPMRFRSFMEKHEEITGKAIGQTPVKKLLFSDFDGSVKSLGAWGGDFVLAASEATEEYVRNYFTRKNLPVIFKYDEIVLRPNSENRLSEPGEQLITTSLNANE